MPAEADRLRLAMLYGAEPYQAWHVSDIAAELSRDPLVDLTILTVDPAIDPLLERLEAGRFPRPVPHERLHSPVWVKLGRKARIFGLLKQQVLAHARNLRRFADFDAVITPATHVAALRDKIPRSTLLIHCNHGAGGGPLAYLPWMRAFDFLVTTGSASIDRYLSDGLATRSTSAAVGLVKLETCRRLATGTPRLFDNDSPTILFNSHSKRSLRSWERFAAPLIEHASRTGEFNLIVAPHVKLFGRRPKWLWRRWERKAVPGRVHVDLGSEASQDMRYALAADLYVGDVSSQLFEFLVEPRPCVFLNAHGVDWRDNPDYPMWRLGEVADTPQQAIALIRTAFDDHPRFAELQRKERIARIGSDEKGMAAKAAQAILDFVRSRRG